MAKLNIPPTKSNLFKIRQSHSIAKEGYSLLSQKREILVIELMSYLERVKRVEKDLSKLLNDAYNSFKKAIYRFGHKEVEDKVKFIKYDFIMKKKTNKLMGMILLSVHIDPPKINLQYSFLNSNAIIDETTNKFLKLLTVICEMAEIRAIVWRLSREVKKTQRRVNALEKIVLPENEETLKYIESSLEERERDELFISKLVKTRMEQN
ncbi:MAG TPA: V-type ATP synthase subunit D [Spirochaetota bacterium]|nr:V-type ATP synthase subunit D [Spirochaetota bacterium]HOL56730.1 V-type ATP synthase subunit D [Spirochaetota bacterium]HPP04177.1 V-type ATP synthase subunit D [Spirochaetota bacterium]